MGKLKYSLISLLAVCLTAGGVFAAWQFTDGTIENPDPVDISVSTEGMENFDYQYVSIKFDASDGQFEDPNQKTEIVCQKDSAIQYSDYESLFPSYGSLPYKVDQNDADIITHYFSHWEQEDGSRFYFDEVLDKDQILTAVYEPITNPILYKKYNNGNMEIAGIFTKNRDYISGEDKYGYIGKEYLLINFVSRDRAYWTQTRNYHYVVRNNSTTDINVLSTTTDNGCQQGADYVYDGLYNVYFRPDRVTGNAAWWTYGNYTFFEKVYNFNIVGVPSGTWNPHGENLISLAYSSTLLDDGLNLEKVYKTSKIYIPNEKTMDDGDTESSREFKISCPFFYEFISLTENDANLNKAMPTLKIAENSKKFLELSNASDYWNLKSKTGFGDYFSISIKVIYRHVSTYTINYHGGEHYNYIFGFYPDIIEVSLLPLSILDNQYAYTYNFYEFNPQKNDFDLYSLPLSKNKTISESLESYRNNSQYLEEAARLSQALNTLKTFNISGKEIEFTFKGFVEDVFNGNPISIDTTKKPTSSKAFYLHYTKENTLYIDNKYIYTEESSLDTIHTVSGNMCYYGTKLLGITDGSDVGTAKSLNLYKASGKYVFTFSSNKWTAKRYIQSKFSAVSSWWTKDNAHLYCYAFGGTSGDSWNYSIEQTNNKSFSNSTASYLIPVDATTVIFTRNSSKNGSWDAKWNQTVDTSLGNYTKDKVLYTISSETDYEGKQKCS